MNTDDTPTRPSQPRTFQTTRWTLVLAARGTAAGLPDARAAVAELCRIYWYPVYGFIRRHEHSAEQAADLTQEFFARLIEDDSFGSADRERGRFRSWLLGAVKHFLANDWKRRTAKKRDFRKDLHVDALTAEQRYSLEPRHHASPDRLFNQAVSVSFVGHAFETLRREHEAKGQTELFDKLACFVPGGELEASVYEPIAESLGIPVNAVKQRVFRLRLRYGKILHREMCELVEHPDDVQDEIGFMLESLESLDDPVA